MKVTHSGTGKFGVRVDTTQTTKYTWFGNKSQRDKALKAAKSKAGAKTTVREAFRDIG